MNRYVFIVLFMSMAVTCGFSWGLGNNDRCDDAVKLVPALSGLAGESGAKQEEKILKLCPDGPPGHFVRGVRLERQGKRSEAIEEYRAAVEKDDTFAYAHGNLGLLLLAAGARDEAAVELTMGLMGAADVRYHKGLGEIFMERGIPSLALFHFREALKGLPGDLSVHLGIAQACYGMGRQNEAEEEFAYVLSQRQNDENALLGLAAVYKKENRYDDEIELLKKADSYNPGNPSIHTLLAEAYRSNGDLAKVDEEYVKAGINREIGPEEYIRRGDEYLLARNYTKALENYGNALKKRPKWPLAMEKRGDAQMASGNDDEAIATYREVLRETGGNSGLHYSLGVLYERKGLMDEAVTEYGNSVRIDPDNGDARRRLADIYTLRGRYPKAIEEYKKLMVMAGDNPIVHFKLARVYEKNRDFQGATEAYQSAIRLDAGNVEAHRELAMLYGKRGMAADAEREYRQVLRLKSDDRDARKALTALFVNQRKYDDLFQLVKEGVETFPNDPSSYYKLGIMHDFRKEYGDAIAQYEKAISLKPDYAKALSALGRTFLRTGELEKAKEALEAAKKADPKMVEPAALLNNLKEDKGGGREMHRKKRHRPSTHGKKKRSRGNKAKKGARGTKGKKGR